MKLNWNRKKQIKKISLNISNTTRSAKITEINKFVYLKKVTTVE
jgi:hypothetical protein